MDFEGGHYLASALATQLIGKYTRVLAKLTHLPVHEIRKEAAQHPPVLFVSLAVLKEVDQKY